MRSHVIAVIACGAKQMHLLFVAPFEVHQCHGHKPCFMDRDCSHGSVVSIGLRLPRARALPQLQHRRECQAPVHQRNYHPPIGAPRTVALRNQQLPGRCSDMGAKCPKLWTPMTSCWSDARKQLTSQLEAHRHLHLRLAVPAVIYGGNGELYKSCTPKQQL